MYNTYVQSIKNRRQNWRMKKKKIINIESFLLFSSDPYSRSIRSEVVEKGIKQEWYHGNRLLVMWMQTGSCHIPGKR